jgi:hypothetical protein
MNDIYKPRFQNDPNDSFWTSGSDVYLPEYAPKDAEQFAESLVNPPEPNERLVELLASPTNAEAERAAFYYIQNKHAGYLGNAPIWWAKGGKGYTAYILNAERFTEANANQMVADDPHNLAMYRCDYVDARLHLVFDSQDFHRLGTDEPCGWPGGYACAERDVSAELAAALEDIAYAKSWVVFNTPMALVSRALDALRLYQSKRGA